MGNDFMHKKLAKYISSGFLKKEDRILVVCGGVFDQEIMEAIGFSNYLITSLHPEENCSIKNYKKENVEHLSFGDNSFDNVIVHAGLHHCYSPHRAVCEMYRVARKNVVIFESQDSFLMRLICRLGLALDYEIKADRRDRVNGGVENLPIPNYVYRWSRRDVEKLVRSLDPVREPDLIFSTELAFITCNMKRDALAKVMNNSIATSFIKATFFILNLFIGRQGNRFAVLIRKEGKRLHQWIKKTKNGYEFIDRSL